MINNKRSSSTLETVRLRAKRYTLLAPLWILLRTWLPSLVLLPACIYFLFRGGDDPLLNLLNLLIHEGGHLWFYLFGDLLHAAGGTLMQILLPGLLVVHFWRYRVWMGMQIALLWLGQNLLDISVYVADARSLELSLLANRQHDWMYLLGELGLLQYDQVFAFAFSFLAIASFIGLLTLPIWMSDKR